MFFVQFQLCRCQVETKISTRGTDARIEETRRKSERKQKGKQYLLDGRRRRRRRLMTPTPTTNNIECLDILPRSTLCLRLLILLTCSRRPAPRLAMATERKEGEKLFSREFQEETRRSNVVESLFLLRLPPCSLRLSRLALANGDEADERDARSLSLQSEEKKQAGEKAGGASYSKNESLKRRRRVRKEKGPGPGKAVVDSLARPHFFPSQRRTRLDSTSDAFLFFLLALFCRTSRAALPLDLSAASATSLYHESLLLTTEDKTKPEWRSTTASARPRKSSAAASTMERKRAIQTALPGEKGAPRAGTKSRVPSAGDRDRAGYARGCASRCPR